MDESISANESPVKADDLQQIDVDAEAAARMAKMTIVIHPGSSLLRIGRASDPQPAQVPHVIAWRRRNVDIAVDNTTLWERNRYEYAEDELTLRQEGLNEAYQDVLSICGRKMATKKDVSRQNKDKVAKVYNEDCGWWWTDTSNAQEFLIGDDALYMDKDDCYDLHWPIVKGQLNVGSGLHGSLTAVLSDIENLWTRSIESFLKIPKNKFQDYRCVLLIPDIFNRRHVKKLVHCLINSFGFSSILIHQESVCAAYGCGIATGCVVDVGHHKTSICCIEDGFSHPQTRICLDYGGRDIAVVFAWLLKRNNFPYRKCDSNERMDALLLEELKDTLCHMDLGKDLPENHEFHLRRPGQKSLLYPITLGFETMQAPFSLFYPKIFGLRMDNALVHLMEDNSGDSEDVFDELFLSANRNKPEDTKLFKREKFDELNSSSLMNDEVSNENYVEDESAMIYSQQSTNDDFKDEMSLLSLDEAVVWSVENCPESYEDELKRRMYSCILLIGGGLANFEGADSFTTRKIQNSIPLSPYQQQMVEQVNVLAKVKDQDPSLLSWKGGSILPCLDNAQELWITMEEWNKHGVKLLRERSPFTW